MAISWGTRGPFFQLLAAVYAELGEEAFKGRYGKIAKYFGPDATYDSIKALFAKEIARVAEQLKTPNREPGATGRARPQRQPGRPPRRPLPLDFEDDEISIVSERGVAASSVRPLRAPAKRARVFVPSSSPDEAVTADQHTNVLDRTTAEPVPNGLDTTKSSHTIQAGTPPASQCPSSYPELPSSSEMPICVPRQSAACYAGPSKQPRLNKRPCPSIQKPIDNHPSHPPHPDASPNPKPEAFGYVTNRGEFRCALCFSQVTSQEALDKHEAMSELHLRNLKNLFLVTKGRAKLAQVTKIPSFRPFQFSEGAVAPGIQAPFDEQPRPGANGNTPLTNGDLSSTHIHNHRPNVEQSQDDSSFDTIEVSRAPPTSFLPQDRNQEEAPTDAPAATTLGVDKGKQRAASRPPATEAHPTLHHPGPHPFVPASPFIPDSNPQPLEIPPPTSPSPSAPIPPCHPTTNTTQPFTTHERAEILRSAGIRIADKWIEDHPNFIAQLNGCVQREFAAVSASANAAGKVGAGGENGKRKAKATVPKLNGNYERGRGGSEGVRGRGPGVVGVGRPVIVID